MAYPAPIIDEAIPLVFSEIHLGH
ncbi:hypothetical protein C5167_006693 [Papaver somniferum]|uniref:Uncharacterized protein n=1 Tax=Papaver somniferum TaxID=3469 RepID=A0A4Y7JFV0_PAPSO|nr:hypothetical protein C5167_006693 [Papaver somniferum]